MSDLKSNASQVAAGWDVYWSGTGAAGQFSIGGVNHPLILSFWDEFFQSVKQNYTSPKMIDIASGNGAVLERAIAVVGNDYGDFSCLDVSQAAIANIQTRFPSIRGVVADASSVPLESGSFDIVTSQFGVEYAGLKAIDEAARLLAADGRLALLLHNQAGRIHQECVESLDAISRLRESGFIPLAVQLLKAGFEACRGADRAPYETAAMQLAPAIQALESIMSQYGEHVAGDTISALYSGVDRIHQNLQRYEPDQVLDWLNRMDGELEAYAERMSSMCACAIDGETFERVCAGLRHKGYATLRAEPLPTPEADAPLAWVLVATKGKRGDEAVPDLNEPTSGEISKDGSGHGKEKLKAWVAQQLKAAVSELTKKQLFDTFLVEAKPAWVLPFQILIGKVRERGQSKDFDWFICGEVPTDLISSNVAGSPREAARYFALKWQLDASREQDLSDQKSPGAMTQAGGHEGLANQAEALYALVEDPRVWLQESDP